MANELIKNNYKAIANAIRSKTGENGTMTAEEMPAKIEAIETGITPTGTKNITANGNNIDVTEYAAVNVDVPSPSGMYCVDTIYEVEANNKVNISEYEKVNLNHFIFEDYTASGFYRKVAAYNDYLDSAYGQSDHKKEFDFVNAYIENADSSYPTIRLSGFGNSTLGFNGMGWSEGSYGDLSPLADFYPGEGTQNKVYYIMNCVIRDNDLTSIGFDRDISITLQNSTIEEWEARQYLSYIPLVIMDITGRVIRESNLGDEELTTIYISGGC